MLSRGGWAICFLGMSARTGTERREGLYQQRCVRCGYVSGELQATRTSEGVLVASALLRCPRCDQDLYTRPARSYAEMEGFVERALPPSGPPPRRVARGVVPRGAATDNEVLVESGVGESGGGGGVRPWVLVVLGLVTVGAVAGLVMVGR